MIIKEAYIKKENGKYKVVSHKGKNLGEYKSKKGAKKRLREVEYFKHMKGKKKMRKKALIEFMMSK